MNHQKFCHASERHNWLYQRHVSYFLPQPFAAVVGLAGSLLLVIMSTAVSWERNCQVTVSWQAGVYVLVCCHELSFTPPFISTKLPVILKDILKEIQPGSLLMSWLILKWASGWKIMSLPRNAPRFQECVNNLVQEALRGARTTEAQEFVPTNINAEEELQPPVALEAHVSKVSNINSETTLGI